MTLTGQRIADDEIEHRMLDLDVQLSAVEGVQSDTTGNDANAPAQSRALRPDEVDVD